MSPFVGLHAKMNSIIYDLKFETPSTIKGLSSNDIQKMHLDRDGLLWIATRYGLYSYDGYEIESYKSNLFTPGLLTNNVILCLTDDNNHNLYVGTERGLNILNKKTGKVRKLIIPHISNNIVSCILVTKNNKVWVGTDSGLCSYEQETDSFTVYENTRTNSALTTTAIKSLIEDSKGNIWIGTWDKGLVRYDPKQQRFYAYPRMNDRNSAHVIYEDRYHNIWVGSWGAGLFMLKDAWDVKKVSWDHYPHLAGNPESLSDNTVYSISENPTTNSLWVGTRSGLSIMDLDERAGFVNYQPAASPHYLPFNEVSTIVCDRVNAMWVGTAGGGVFRTGIGKPFFELCRPNFRDHEVPTKSIRRLQVDHEGMVWMGISGYGIGRCDIRGENIAYYKDIPEFSGISNISTVMAMMQRRNGEMWFGMLNGLIYIYEKGKKVRAIEYQKTPYMKSYYILSLMEDAKGNCWIGTRDGLSVLYANGGGYLFEHFMVDGKGLGAIQILTLFEDSDGVIWLGTKSNGIIALRGNIYTPQKLQFKGYNAENGKFSSISVTCMEQDKMGRIWVGTEGNGLYLYDPQKDTFESVNQKYNIFADVVNGIQVDDYGSLWMSTNEGLLKLTVYPDKEAVTHVYTRADGLQNSFFTTGASDYYDGGMFFGGTDGFNVFYPTKVEEKFMDLPVILTDIQIYDLPFGKLDEETQKCVSKEMPAFTRHITIPADCNNFSLKFSLLSYDKSALCRYAYKLEGFDQSWQYTDGARRTAYYNNLKAGTYKFLLKAANANGIWSSEVKEITVEVLPPLYATWWAFCIYILIAVILGYFLFRLVRNRMVLQNQLRLSNMEQAKSEEMNHAKLQFFTNITHEILTPLTIISAAVDELKLQMPLHKEYYSVMSKNINRLMRLIQQILEFRKAETGNLKLRVSEGDIVPFVRNAVEAFRPLIRKRKLHFSIVCDPEQIHGYFDMDKLDKILYNLISNAAKYSNENGFVLIDLSLTEDRKHIRLIVKDNGKGISNSEQQTLFTRFYEGNYRRFNTIGTGIGLALTKDLVTLWGGTIQVESEMNKGTQFIVTLPVDRSAFTPDQIDEEIQLPQQIISGMEEVTEEEAEMNGSEPHKPCSVLLVEDEEELLNLMVKLLSNDYNVFFASNGKEALTIMEREEIDLVVTDVSMPQMDGIELCREIKGKLEFSHIPVLMLTAKTAEEDRTAAYESGADGYITKPFNLSVLHARIKNLLRTKERRARDFNRSVVFEIQDLNYTSVDEEFLKDAIACVNKHLDDADFDQPQMVDDLGTSKSTLYKKLKTLTGLNPSAFIRNIRLKAACQIMDEKKSLRISELAYAVGFKDAKYFSSCFRKEFGMLPREYMNRYAADGEVIEDTEDPEGL